MRAPAHRSVVKSPTQRTTRPPAWAGCVRACGPAIVALLLTGLSARATPPQPVAERVRAAQTAYESESYAEAVGLYREVLASGWNSPQLYYNLGCASLKAGEVGWAVAYLEQARRLAPRDPEIRHNLQVIRAGLRDRLPPAERSWLLDLLTVVLDDYAPADAVSALLLVIWLAALGVAAHWLLDRTARRWTRLLLRLIGALAVLVVMGLLLKAHQIQAAPSGVVVAREVAVLAGPREGESVQFSLRGGALVHLGRAAGEWREIWLTDQMRGWAPEEGITHLRPPRWIP